MDIEIQLTSEPIPGSIPAPTAGVAGAWVEFRGVVRGEEKGREIAALEYEAYPEMARRETHRLLAELSAKHDCLVAKVIHRTGTVPVGEAAIYIGVAGRHRAGALALITQFLDRLKQDVPIWKRRAIAHEPQSSEPRRAANSSRESTEVRSLVEAISEIELYSQPLPAVRVPLNDAFGRVLRETVTAAEDFPSCDRSTRDGYAIRQDDAAETFQIVDTLHAADWRPRQLKPGETVRVATGASLPSAGLRVVMQEHGERNGDQFKIVKREGSLNLRKRGEDTRAGQTLVSAGARLDAGRLALLATAGCAAPLVSPRLRIVHLTTGDEIVPPDQTPKPGQIRDSNSILIRGLLQRLPCEVDQRHLPEDFQKAKLAIEDWKSKISRADVLLVSGGASVGDKDFTRPLLEWLGFEVVFTQVNVRPGRPIIFGVAGGCVAFGLPGNPVSHFACFHFAVAPALARLAGEVPPKFSRGRLAVALDDAASPRETLWPARLTAGGLQPLPWASSGDVTCFAAANALLRVPANCASIVVGAEVDYLPAGSNFCYDDGVN